MAAFSKHFTYAELKCKGLNCCGGKAVLQPGFIEALEKLRENYGRPMAVTSGCRCAAHNKAIGGHPRSLHLIGNPAHGTDCCAVDVAWHDGTDLSQLQTEALALGFSIGLASNFIHLDWRFKCARLQRRSFHYLK